jgi:hypothetical protein
MSLRRRALLLSCCALVALPAAGCGNKHARTTFGETEGSYLDVGQLKYQVQISRVLNRFDNEDKAYLQGLAPADARLATDEAWFAVFVRVENPNTPSVPAVNDFEMHDTQGNVYTPLPVAPSNVFAYRGGPVPGHGQLPMYDTPAFDNPSIRGLMLLFKVKQHSLDLRPLEFVIKGPNEASVDLDV